MNRHFRVNSIDSTADDENPETSLNQNNSKKDPVLSRVDESNDECKSNASTSSKISGKKVHVGSVESTSRQTRIIADAEISRQLGMITESLGPSYDIRRSGSIINNQMNNLDDVINIDKRMAARSAELEFRRNTFWKGCCDSVIDRRATVFFTQVGVGAVVAIFAISKILTAEPYNCTGDDPSVYIGLISLILGWFAPAPTMK